MSAPRNLKKRANQFVVCIGSEGCEASLERRKIYQTVSDIRAERRHLLRVIDESGEDYLYPESFFLPIEVSKAVERGLFAVA